MLESRSPKGWHFAIKDDWTCVLKPDEPVKSGKPMKTGKPVKSGEPVESDQPVDLLELEAGNVVKKIDSPDNEILSDKLTPGATLKEARTVNERGRTENDGKTKTGEDIRASSTTKFEMLIFEQPKVFRWCQFPKRYALSV